MQYKTIAVLGGSGFVGEAIVHRLVAQGRRVKVATRRRAHAQRLSVLPIDIIECDINQPAQLARFLASADAVINLVGILNGRRGRPYGQDFAAAHVELPRQLIEACRRARIERVLHMSALGTDAAPAGDSRAPSMYLRSKSVGEALVRAATDLHTTVFKPSVIVGDDDGFITLFASLHRVLPLIPLAAPNSRFQPIWVGDVAQAFVNALDMPAACGASYELGGPRAYTLEELVRQIGRGTGHPRPILRLPRALARLQAMVAEHLPGALVTRDNLDSMSIDSVLDGELDAALRLVPTSFETILANWRNGRRSRAVAFMNSGMPDGRE